MKLSELKVEESKPVVETEDTKEVAVSGGWCDVSNDTFLSWPASKQWRYCFQRDMYEARRAQNVLQAEFFRNRAMGYLAEAKVAEEQEAALEARTATDDRKRDWRMFLG